MPNFEKIHDATPKLKHGGDLSKLTGHWSEGRQQGPGEDQRFANGRPSGQRTCCRFSLGTPHRFRNMSGEVCANCAKESSDAVRLKNCTACRLVKYCSVDCKRAHWKQHKGECERRASELKEEQLPREGDFCPICTLPIPLPMSEHSVLQYCCMKKVCLGCWVAAAKRGMPNCPFCRTRYLDNDADRLAMIMARVEKKDPDATNFLGHNYSVGGLGLQTGTGKSYTSQ